MAKEANRNASEDEVKETVATAGPEPEGDGEFDEDVLTTDMALWAGFRAQRVVARALANDRDAECLTFEQCEALTYLLRRSPKCIREALAKHLELVALPLDLDNIDMRGLLLEAFRSAFLAVETYFANKAAREAVTPVLEVRKVPVSETTLELVDEPLAVNRR